MMPITADYLATWQRDAEPGNWPVYHTGSIAHDRRSYTDHRCIDHYAVPGLNALANAVLRAAGRGEVLLFQRRLEPGRYAYLAVRAEPGRAIPAARYSIGRRIIEAQRAA